MNNPALRDYRSRILYTCIWMIIMIIQALGVYYFSGLPIVYAVVDSFVFNLIFACLAIPLWYPVRYNSWKERPWYLSLIIHITLSGLFLLPLWIGSGCLLMYFLTSGDKVYLHFMVMSVGWKVVEGLLFYIMLILVYYLYMHIEKLNEQTENEIRLNRLLKDGELNLLKSQINPHFLFNSLNSLHSLILKSPGQAGDMLVALSDYLRYTVVSTRQPVSNLQEEMGNIERYLSIEKLRFGDKLNYELNIDPGCMSATIPSMLLQPLFENAVKHGVYESLKEVCISATIKKVEYDLQIEISNNFDPENVGIRKGSGTGLRNTGDRLNLLYGAHAVLQTKTENEIFTVMIRFPLKIEH